MSLIRVQSPAAPAGRATGHREPPFGADPNRPLYRSGAAAVRGGKPPTGCRTRTLHVCRGRRSSLRSQWSVRPAGFEPANTRTSSVPVCQLRHERKRAAVRCRPGRPALRGRGRSRARRHGFRGWSRTTGGMVQSHTGLPATHPETVRGAGVESAHDEVWARQLAG